MVKYRLKPKLSKYKNQKTVLDGIRFDSKLEASYYMYLKTLQLKGVVNFFLRQVPIHLSADVTYRVDFQVFYADGLIDFVDVKGFETETFKIKKKLVEDKYPFSLNIVSKVNWNKTHLSI